MGRARWYFGTRNAPTGKVQIDTVVKNAARGRTGTGEEVGPLRLSEHILRLAQAEYERHFSGQDYERMQERGGLSLLEVVGLLADYVDRQGGKPTKPRVSESVPSHLEGERE